MTIGALPMIALLIGAMSPPTAERLAPLEMVRGAIVQSVSDLLPPSGIMESWIAITVSHSGARHVFHVRFMFVGQFIPPIRSQCDIAFRRQFITGNTAAGQVDEKHEQNVITHMTCDTGNYYAD